MFRYLAIVTAIVVCWFPGAALGGGKGDRDIKIADKLTNSDPKDKIRNAASKVHVVKMKAGTMYTIDMVSKEFDSYLRLEDKDGKQLDEDDDSGGDLNARIVFNCTKDGDYKVICTAYSMEGMGSYVLTVKTGTGVAKVASSHETMIGKVAPDFRGDFALNGKAVGLSDLKGKVVLLDFWSVVSADSIAAFPKLNEWHKKFKQDGLEIVGVTYFGSEIGQNFGFDKAAGKVTRIAEATGETDRAMLKDFATHHKLDHLLLALKKDAALQSFGDYGVNGVPQLVLIDRQGMVRLVRVGFVERGVESLENEIKKLLSEK